MANIEEDEEQMMWLDEGEEEDGGTFRIDEFETGVGSIEGMEEGAEASSAEAADAVRRLQAELIRTRQELVDVRKDLASKTVQLSRKEQVVAQERAAERAAEAAVAVAPSEHDPQLQLLMERMHELEMTLHVREEELDESKRLYQSQRRALRDAVNAVADREASDQSQAEASTSAASAAAEDELERLQQELVLTKTRSEMELKAKEGQLARLKKTLAEAAQSRQDAVSRAESALTEAWQAEVGRVGEEGQQRVAELEREVLRLRTQMEDERRRVNDVGLSGELAAMNNNKVQIQREFEAFKEVASSATRSKREEMANLLEENATLKSKLAARAVESYLAGNLKGGGGGFLGGGGSSGTRSLTAAGGGGRKVFDSMPVASPASSGFEQLLQGLARLDQQRRGLVPSIIIMCLLSLMLTVAVVRATASAHEQHRGMLCVLAKLGVKIGKGCGAGAQVELVDPLLQLLDAAPRIHDIEVESGMGTSNSLSGSSSIDFDDSESGAGGSLSSERSSSSSSSSGAEAGGGVIGSLASAAQHHRQLLSLCYVFARRGLHCFASSALPG
ncbi:MAG: hypothetical protein WDW38_008170 [Sanguina aurantia]